MGWRDDDNDDVEFDIRKPSYHQPNDPESDLTSGDILVAILCSGIGCILGIVYLVQGKPKAMKMIGLSMLVSFAWGLIRFAIESSATR